MSVSQTRRADAAPRPRRPPVGSRRSFRGSACRSDYLYRLPVLETARLRALPRYRVSRSDATRSPGAGSGLIREFEGRGHADPGDRERDTRATRLTVISRSHPKVGHSKHCRARGPRGPRWAWLPRGHAQFAESAAASVIYSISNVIQYKFRLHRVHARASCDSHRGDPGLNHTSRFEDRHTPTSSPIRSLNQQCARA